MHYGRFSILPAGRKWNGKSMRGRNAVLILVAVALGVIAWAWIDGGRQPVREISVPVAVPEIAR
ncbi:MAG: hypothetical protein V4579_01080 [Pseudomonadota bacterium]